MCVGYHDIRENPENSVSWHRFGYHCDACDAERLDGRAARAGLRRHERRAHARARLRLGCSACLHSNAVARLLRSKNVVAPLLAIVCPRGAVLSRWSVVEVRLIGAKPGARRRGADRLTRHQEPRASEMHLLEHRADTRVAGSLPPAIRYERRVGLHSPSPAHQSAEHKQNGLVLGPSGASLTLGARALRPG